MNYLEYSGPYIYNKLQFHSIQIINDDKSGKRYEPSFVCNLHYSFESSENARRIIYIARHQRMTKNSVYMNKYTNYIYLVTPILDPI